MVLKSEHTPELAALESVLLRIDELPAVLGSFATPTIGLVRGALLEALAARDRGDQPAAVAAIGRAMDALSALADRLDPTEAAMMRAVAHSFRVALSRGDYARAKETAAVMMKKSGAVERKKD